MFKDLLFKSKSNTQKQAKKNESGRSMVEMLGVLAIMGILSIGAIAGYRYAIDSYKANETINELTLRAVSVGEQVRQNRGTLTMDEFPATTRQGYPVTAFREPDDPKLFELEVTDVPVGVCQKILKMGWKLPVLIKANEIVYGGNDLICEPSEMDNRETATMVFLFDEDLDETALPTWYCEKDSDCGSCQRCQENICVSSCEGNERCAQDTETGEQICCPKERRSGPYCCQTKKNGMCCNEHDQCCPWYKPLAATNGDCFECGINVNVDVGEYPENCAVCSERELNGSICRLKCPADQPSRDYVGKCHSCDDLTAFIPDSNEECAKCSQRSLIRLPLDNPLHTFCYIPCGVGLNANKPILDINGICHSCDEAVSFDLRGGLSNQCALCGNRQLYGEICSVRCPPETPLPDSNGNCFPCDYEKVVYNFQSEEGCMGVCSNRILTGNQNNYCALPCTPEKPLGDYLGNCHSCDELEAVSVSGVQDHCDICPNRELVNKTQCVIKANCPSDRPLKDAAGNCYACDEPNIVLDAVDCSVCPNRISPNCHLPCDEGIYEDMPLEDRFGRCFSCDTPQQVDVYGTLINCSVCSNREVVSNQYCSLKRSDN